MEYSLNQLVKEWSAREGYQAPLVLGSNPNVVILGEKPGRKKVQKAQRNLISLVRPGYLLHELAGVHQYDPAQKEWRLLEGIRMKSPNRKYQESFDSDCPHTDIAEELGIPIIGIGICGDEIEQLTGQRKPKGVHCSRIRESRMANRIIEYSSITDAPIVAIVGAKHISPTVRSFHDPLSKMDYILVNQSR